MIKKRNYELEYYGLLHVLKELSFELKLIRDSLVDSSIIDKYVDLIDHEASKACYGAGR